MNRRSQRRLEAQKRKQQTSKLNTPRQKEVACESPQQTSDNKENSTKREELIVSQIPPAPTNKKQPKQPWYKTFPYRKTLEIIGIVAGIAYAAVTYLQWRDLKHNFEASERPVIFAQSVDVPLSMMGTEDDLGARVVFLNAGRTLAVNAFLHAAIDLRDTPLIGPATPAGATRPGERNFRVLGPFDIAAGQTQAIEVSYGKPISPEELRALDSGTKFLYIFGWYSYNDISGQHYPVGVQEFTPGEPMTHFGGENYCFAYWPWKNRPPTFDRFGPCGTVGFIPRKIVPLSKQN